MPVTLIKSKWSSGSLIFYPNTDDTGTINFGDGTTDCDVKIFLGSTTEYVDFNVGDSTMAVTAALSVSGATTITGAVTLSGTVSLQGVTTLSAATTISTATATTISNYGAAIFAFTSSTTVISDSVDAAAGTASGYIAIKVDGNVRYLYIFDEIPGS